MKRQSLGLSLMLLLGLASQIASAGDAYVTTHAHLRTGPDANYPSILTVPGGSRVHIEGCINDWSWCDAKWGRERGWISGGLLEYDYQSQRVGIYDYGPHLGLPILTFVLSSYWESYYRYRPWYHQRAHWNHYHPVYRPRPPQPARPVQPLPPLPGGPQIRPPRPVQPLPRPGGPQIQPPRPTTKPSINPDAKPVLSPKPRSK